MEQIEQVRAQSDKYFAIYRSQLDQLVPHVTERWIGLAILLTIFVLRILVAQGWYVVTYALFIFLLNLFLAFLTPRFDPSVQDDIRAEDAEEGVLPVSQSEEFRPFIRRLPEFRFWQNATTATLIALVCSFIPILDVPVYWPILVIYFLILVALTMRRQIQHMIKYRYIPFDFGKKKFTTSK